MGKTAFNCQSHSPFPNGTSILSHSLTSDVIQVSLPCSTPEPSKDTGKQNLPSLLLGSSSRHYHSKPPHKNSLTGLQGGSLVLTEARYGRQKKLRERYLSFTKGQTIFLLTLACICGFSPRVQSPRVSPVSCRIFSYNCITRTI